MSGAGPILRERPRVQPGGGLPVPHRRTFAAPILGSAHSELPALRHPCLRWSATPAPGARAARRLFSQVQWNRGKSRGCRCRRWNRVCMAAARCREVRGASFDGALCAARFVDAAAMPSVAAVSDRRSPGSRRPLSAPENDGKRDRNARIRAPLKGASRGNAARAWSCRSVEEPNPARSRPHPLAGRSLRPSWASVAQRRLRSGIHACACRLRRLLMGRPPGGHRSRKRHHGSMPPLRGGHGRPEVRPPGIRAAPWLRLRMPKRKSAGCRCFA